MSSGGAADGSDPTSIDTASSGAADGAADGTEGGDSGCLQCTVECAVGCSVVDATRAPAGTTASASECEHRAQEEVRQSDEVPWAPKTIAVRS